MKAYVDYDFNTDKKYIMVAIKALVCQYIDKECVYVTNDFNNIVPRMSKQLYTGIYLCKFRSMSEYVQTLKGLMNTASGFLIPADDYDSLYAEYEQMFNVPEDKDLPMYLEPKQYFNDEGFMEFKNTITILVHHWNLTYNKVAYDVPENPADRRSPKYYAREMLDKLKDPKYNSARAFTNATDKMQYDACNIRNSVESLRNYCIKVCNGSHEQGYHLCVYYIEYIDGSHDQCYAYTASDLYNQINRKKRNMVLCIYLQAKCLRPLEIGEIYLVEFGNGKQYSYIHKNMTDFNKIFGKHIKKNKTFTIR